MMTLIDKQGLQDKTSTGETSQQVRNILHKQAESRMRQGKAPEAPPSPWDAHPQGMPAFPSFFMHPIHVVHLSSSLHN